MELNKIYNEDCLDGMKRIPDGSIDIILTDIPYNEVNKNVNRKDGLRVINKGYADIGNFNLRNLITTFTQKIKGSLYVFCGFEQVSEIVRTLRDNGLKTRIIVWEKTNPSPLGGKFTWLSGIELCVFAKKSGATFNLHCKNTVIRNKCGSSKIHPTQKPVDLFRKLILASTNKYDIVLDPFVGSGTTAIACMREKRNFIGFELNKEYYEKACERIKQETDNISLF